jgi:hypothetical protein
LKENRSSASDSDAVFIGWQKTHLGSIFALYIVTVAGHPLCGSTVSEKTLKKQNLRPPPTQPGFEGRRNSPDTRQGEQA